MGPNGGSVAMDSGLIFSLWWNVCQKSAIATLCVLCDPDDGGPKQRHCILSRLATRESTGSLLSLVLLGRRWRERLNSSRGVGRVYGGKAGPKLPSWWNVRKKVAIVSLCTLSSVVLNTFMPNSWTYNFVEVSGHNLGSYQTWGLYMDFWKHRKGGTSGFPPLAFTVSRNFTVEICKMCVSLKK